MGSFAFEELEPVLFIRGLGTARPEGLELLTLAELIGDLAPKEMVWVVAAVEGSEFSRVVNALAWSIPPQYVLRSSGCLASRPKPTSRWVLPPPIACLRWKTACVESSSEPGDTLADEVLHALGDVRLLEELAIHRPQP